MAVELFAPNSVGNLVLADLEKRVWDVLETQRIRDAQKLYDWYFNNKYEIQSCIKDSLRKTFKPQTVNRLNIRVINIVERTISKLAKVYKEPAVRMLDGGITSEATKKGDSVTVTTKQSAADKIFQDMLAQSTIAKKSKEWHKLGKLFNTVLVQPMYIENPNEDPYMNFRIHTPAWTVVQPHPDDYLKAARVWYPIWANVDNKIQQVLVYWSPTEHFLLTRTGQKLPPKVDAPQGMSNPYGRLPFAVLRFREGTDFWGEGMWDLVEGNEEICVQLANICFVTLFQSFGQPVAVNMNLPPNVRLGPDAPITVDNAEGGSSGKAPPSFEFAQSNTNVAPVQSLIDWLTKLLPAVKGLGPQGMEIEAKIASGVSKMADSIDVQEQREDDVMILEDFEHELYEVMRVVWNAHGSPKIPEGAEFSVKFAKPKVTKTVDEKTKERDSGLKNGVASRVDMILEDNPEMSREQAREKLKEILAENREFEDKFGLFTVEASNTPPNEPEPGNQPPRQRQSEPSSPF